jgi:hypothetical protein
MTTKKSENVHRFGGYFDLPLAQAVQEIADREKRSFNSTVAMLTQAAINERNRKKKK